MPISSDIRPIIQKHSTLPMERLRVVDRFEDVHLCKIQRGIVFILAVWSAPSLSALCKFSQAMQDLPIGSLDLVILDTDCLTDASALLLSGSDGFSIGGAGETFWIRDGLIIARERATSATQQTIRNHTKPLL